MQQIYVLDTIHASDMRLFAGGQWVNDTRERCPACRAFVDGTEPAEIHIALNRLGRRGFTEFLWNSHGLPIFRQDLVTLWRRAGLTGFELKPVRIVGWYEKPRKPLPADIPQYYRLVTTSRVRLKHPPPVAECSECGFVRYGFPRVGSRLPDGIQVDQASWDGSDFCGLAGYTFVFCTHRAAELTLQGGYNQQIAFVREQDWNRWEEFDIRKWVPKDYYDYVEGFMMRRPEQL